MPIGDVESFRCDAPKAFLVSGSTAAAAEDYEKGYDYKPDPLIVEQIAKTVIHNMTSILCLESLSLFDEVILTDIYPAREEPIPGVTSELIYNCLDKNIEKAMCSRADVLNCIENEKNNIEVLVSLGAGDIENDILEMKKILENR